MAGKPLQFDIEFNAQTNADQVTADLNTLLRATKDANEEIASSAKKTLAQLAGYSGKTEIVNEIQFKTNTDGLRQAVVVQKEINKGWMAIEQNIKQGIRTQENSLTSLKGQLREATQLRDSIRKTVQNVDALGRQIQAVNPAWDQQNQKVLRLRKELEIASASNFWQKAKAEIGFGGLLSAANGLSQLVDVFQSISIVIGQLSGAVNGLINSFKEIQSFQMSFEAIGAGASAGTTAFKEASNIASRLGTELASTRDGFKQLAPVVLGVGGNIDDVSNIIEALSTRFAAFGRSSEETRRIMNGVTQAFAKGKLMSEELTQQIAEADPAFKTDLAKAIGVSSAALEALVKNGDITAKKLIEILPRMAVTSQAFEKLGLTARDAVKGLAEGGVTVTQVSNKFKTLQTLSFERLGQSLQPFLVAILQAQAGVIDFLSVFSQTSVIKSLGESLGAIVQITSQVVQNLLAAGQAVLGFVKPLLDLFNLASKIPGAINLISTGLTAYLFTALFKTIGGVEAIKNSILGLVGVFVKIGGAIREFVVALTTGQAAVAGTNASMAGTAAAANSLVAAITGAGVAAENTATKNNSLGAAQSRLQTLLSSTAQSSAPAATGIRNVGVAADGALARVTALGGGLNGLAASMTKQAGAAVVGAQGINSYLPPLEEGRAKAIDYGRAMQIAGDASLTTAEKAARLGNLKNLSSEQVDKLGDAMINASRGADMAGKSAGVMGRTFGVIRGPINAVNAALSTTIGMMIKFEIIVRTIQLLTSAMDFLSQASQETTSVTQAAKEAQEGLNKALKDYGPNASAAAGATEEVKTKTQEVLDELKQADAAAQKARSGGVMGWLQDVFLTDWGASGAVLNAIKSADQEIAKISQTNSVADQILSQYNASLGEYNTQNIKAVAGIKQILKSQDSYIAALKQEYLAKQQAMAATGGETTQERKALDALKSRIEKLTQARDKLKDKAVGTGIDVNKINDTATVLDGMKDNIEEAIKAAEQLGKTKIDDIKAKLEVDLTQVEEAKRKLKELYDLAKERISEQKRLLKDESDTKLEGYDKEKEKIKENYDATKEALSKAKDAIEENADAAKTKIDERLKTEVSAIEATITASDAAHTRRMAQLDAQAQRINEAHNQRMAQLDEEEQRQLKAAEARFTGAGSATQQLAELDAADEKKKKEEEIQRLRASGDAIAAAKLQERVRLEEQAAQEKKKLEEEQQQIAQEYEKKREQEKLALAANLAAIDAQRQQAEKAHEEEMKALQEEKAAKEEEAAAKKEAIDKQLAADKKASEEKARSEELKFKQETAALDKKIEDEKKKAKEEQKKLDEEERKIEKKFKADMSKLEEEERTLRQKAAEAIKVVENDIKKTKEDAAKVVKDSNAAAEASLSRQLDTIRKMVAAYAQLKPPGAAAGGPVSGGSTYTVNELGKEAFLSASGRLSMINAPSWGDWRAPTSGVVIPAHLTRMLNIPAGGVNLNSAPRVNTRRVSRAPSPLAAVMAAINRPSSGMTSDQASNITATQAQQAVAIGKLSKAVRELTRKDWNVNVNLRNGGAPSSYLHALNTLR